MQGWSKYEAPCILESAGLPRLASQQPSLFPTAMVALREPASNRPPAYVSFTATPEDCSAVYICHPTFTGQYGEDISFLSLAAYDSDPAHGTWGIHHRTTLDACCIVANNAHGYLSTTCDGTGRVPIQWMFWRNGNISTSCPPPAPHILL